MADVLRLLVSDDGTEISDCQVGDRPTHLGFPVGSSFYAGSITLWACPRCDLLASRVDSVAVAGDGDQDTTEHRCIGGCGHVFGILIDGGSLDVGVPGG